MANITEAIIAIDDGTVTWDDVIINNITTTGTITANAITLDAETDIILDADNYGYVAIKDAGTELFTLYGDSSQNYYLRQNIYDKSLFFRVNTGTSGSASWLNAVEIQGTNGAVVFNGSWIAGGTSNGYLRMYGDSGSSNFMQINDDGKVGVGANPTRDFEVSKATDSGTVLGLSNWGTSAASAGAIRFQKSRATSIGTFTATADGDLLGTLGFYGSDSAPSASARSAWIDVEQVGSAGGSTVASKMVFGTASTESMTLSGGDDPILEFNTDGILRTSSGNLTLQAAGDMYLRSQGSQNWYFGAGAATKTMYIDDMADNPVIFFRASRFGYSSSYKTMIFGAPTGAQTICLGVDVSANSNGGFVGAGGEIIFRNNMRFMTPNDANDGFHNYMRMNDGLTTFYTNIYPSSNYTYNLGGGGSIYNGLWVGQINAAGNVFVTNQGYGTHNVGQGAMKLQIGYSDHTAGLSLARFSADNYGPSIRIAMSKHATINAHTAVTGATSGTSSTLGTIGWYGSDGNDFDNGAAAIIVKASTNASSNSVSGRMVFATSASGNTWTDRMTIAHDGMVGIGTEVPSNMLQIRGGNGNQFRLDNASETWTQQNFANNGTDKTFLALDHSNHYFVWGTQNSYSSFDSFRIRNGNTELMTIDANGDVGIGTTTPSTFKSQYADGTTLDISGNLPLVIGSDDNGAGRTNTTKKAARIVMPHYTNAEEPTAIIMGISDQNASYVKIGGGSDWMNAVEQIDFYTAGNTTTPTGSLRGSFNDSGNFFVYQNIIMPAAKGLYLDGGSDVYIVSGSGNLMSFYSGGGERFRINGADLIAYANLGPEADASRNLGSASYRWLDSFICRLKNADGNASVPSFTFADDLDTGMYRQGTNVLGFTAGGYDTMYINGGVVKVGDVVYNTTVISNSSIFGANAPANYYAITAKNPTYNWAAIGVQQTGSQASAANYLIAFYDNGGYVGGIYHASNDVTYYSTVSDYRLKENETLITGALDRIKRLKPYRFNFKRFPSEIAEGFFAHELDVEVPFAVAGVKDAMQGEDDPEPGEINPQQVDNAKIIPVLVAAIQELEKRVAELEGS